MTAGLTLCVGILLSAGIAKLTAVLVNWLEAHPLHKFAFLLTKLAGVGAFPVALVWHWYFAESPGAILKPEWLAFTASATIGLCWLLYDAIRFQTRQRPACVTNYTSQLHDLRAEVGPSVMGHGRGRQMVRLPGNQQFLLDCVRYEVALPDLPPEWDGLTIAHFSDAHFRDAVAEPWYAAVTRHIAAGQPDLILFTGDLLDNPRRRAWIPATFGRLSAPLGCWYLLGNHDWLCEPDASRSALEAHGWQPLAGRTVELRRGGVGIFLAGTECPWMPPRPDIGTFPPGSFRILASHSPDELEWARQHGFQFMFAGHTHGGQIRLPLLGPVFAPSRYGVRFSAGEFLVEPTFLAVSRGLSGRDPLRYNCPPQIAHITLRRQNP